MTSTSTVAFGTPFATFHTGTSSEPNALGPSKAAYLTLGAGEPRAASGAASFSNYHNSMFGAVTRAIQLMGRLADGHPYRIESDVVRIAVDLLGVLSSKQEAQAPQIFNLDEETLVLKWIKNGCEQFVSLSSDEVDFAEFVQGGAKRAERSLGEPGQLDYAEFYRALDLHDRASSTPDSPQVVTGLAYA